VMIHPETDVKGGQTYNLSPVATQVNLCKTPKAPLDRGLQRKVEIRQKVRTWAPATGIKRPVLSTFTKRMCRDGRGMCRKAIFTKGCQPRPSGKTHRKLMLKGKSSVTDHRSEGER
jgi:hypothetical protein